jgi:hypothetical protein
MLAIYFLVYFLDVNFPEDRAAFYFIPLFLLLLIFLLDELKRFKILAFSLLFFPVYLFFQLNIQGSIFSADERVPAKTQSIITQLNYDKPTIGIYKTHTCVTII